jgi:hypothetical protein
LQIKRSKYPSPPLSLIQDDLDATNKINDLASKTTVVKQLTSDAKQLSTVVKQSEPEPEPEPETKREKKARGTRLTQDFVLPEDFLEYCSIKHPHLNPHAVFEEFKDYYLSKGEVKADWGATWRNWLRKEGTFKNSSTTAKPSSKPNLIAGAI